MKRHTFDLGEELVRGSAFHFFPVFIGHVLIQVPKLKRETPSGETLLPRMLNQHVDPIWKCHFEYFVQERAVK